jgi:hypothetical protein
MLTLFTASDFVTCRHGVFEVTGLAREFLVAGSPWFMGLPGALSGGRAGAEAGSRFASPPPRHRRRVRHLCVRPDGPPCASVLAASFSALEPGGLLLIHDAHLDADKRGPLPVAEYSALLMHSTEGKCYSRAEMSSYLGDAGFSGVTFTATAADRSVITALR